MCAARPWASTLLITAVWPRNCLFLTSPSFALERMLSDKCSFLSVIVCVMHNDILRRMYLVRRNNLRSYPFQEEQDRFMWVKRNVNNVLFYVNIY